MRFQRYDEIVTDHSTPSSESAATLPDTSWRVVRLLRRITRIVACLLAAGFVLLAVSFLLFRLVLLPQLNDWRGELSAMASEATGMQVKVGRITGDWAVWAPVLTLYDVAVLPAVGAEPVRLSRVELMPAWKSWLYLEPRLSHLQLDDLQLSLQRDTIGRLSINGVALSGKGDNKVADWLLRQDNIVLGLREASWHDRLLGLPVLRMQGMKLQLQQGWFGHRLNLAGRSDSALLPGLSIDASWRGDGLDDWAMWRGEVKMAAGSGELSLLKRYWPEAPFAARGRADSSLQATFAEGRITTLNGRWQVDDVVLALQQQQLPLPKLAGEVDYQSPNPGEHRFQARHLTVQGESGLLLRDASAEASWHVTRGGRVSASGVSLDGLFPLLMRYVPVLRDSAISRAGGALEKLSWQWQGPWRAPVSYRVGSHFQNLNADFTDGSQLRGGLSGEFVADQQGGKLHLASKDVRLQLPDYLENALQLRRVSGDVLWQHNADGWQASWPQLKLATPDFDATLDGSVQQKGNANPQLQLSVTVPQVAITRIASYLPTVVGTDTLQWLRDSLKDGQASDMRASVKGDLNAFPYAGGKGGQFDVDADIRHGVLRFEPDWPLISHINGRFAMRNDKISITGDRAQTGGVALRNVLVELPDLMRDSPHLLINGEAQGTLPDMLAYTVASPVDGWLDGFLASIQAAGHVSLGLKLDIPLDEAEKTKVNGKLALQDNHLVFRDLPLPPLAQVGGVLQFDEHGVSSPGIRFAAFDGKGELKANQQKGRMYFTVQGDAAITPVLNEYVPLLAPLVSGHSPYQAAFTIGSTLEHLQIDLSLAGVGIDAPAPLDKPLPDAWPLRLDLRPTFEGWHLSWQQAQRASGQVLLDAQGELAGLGIGIGADVPSAAGVLAINVAQAKTELLPWVALVEALANTPSSGGSNSLPLQLQLKTDVLQLGPYLLHDVAGNLHWAAHADAPLVANWQSREADGKLTYGTGKPLTLDLARLALPLQAVENAGVVSGDAVEMPALKLKVDELRWKKRALGVLQLSTVSTHTSWQLDNLTLLMPEGHLRLQGVVPKAQNDAMNSEVDVAIVTTDAGAALARFGMADMLVGGAGRLEGHLAWQGRFEDFALAGLGGALRLELRQGRFAQIDPGAGRLLGILSLQSLSRRIRLDFTDVFSSGFAFDEITGDAAVKQGVFRTDNLLMNGPSAKVVLRGEADLVKGSQDVRARITPHLSESVSLIAGASLLNPLLGAAAFVTQKILQDPINQVFSFDYHIRGSLTDPEVSKVDN